MAMRTKFSGVGNSSPSMVDPGRWQIGLITLHEAGCSAECPTHELHPVQVRRR